MTKVIHFKEIYNKLKAIGWTDTEISIAIDLDGNPSRIQRLLKKDLIIYNGKLYSKLESHADTVYKVCPQRLLEIFTAKCPKKPDTNDIGWFSNGYIKRYVTHHTGAFVELKTGEVFPLPGYTHIREHFDIKHGRDYIYNYICFHPSRRHKYQSKQISFYSLPTFRKAYRELIQHLINQKANYIRSLGNTKKITKEALRVNVDFFK